MLDFVRSYMEERAQIRREVDALIAEHGADSFLEAIDRAFDVMDRTGWDSTQTERAWNVGRGVELRLKIHHQPDTATRYLERLPRSAEVRGPAGRQPWHYVPAISPIGISR